MSTAVSTHKDRINIQQHGAGGLLWLAAWLFTIGLLKLTFWQGAMALVTWPYLLGVKAAVWLATGTPGG
jgi:hypothetical protein